MVRVFTGVALPRACQAQLGELVATWQPRLASRTTWTRPGNGHLTLKFLGEMEESSLPALREALGGVRFAPFSLQVGGGGFFPPRGAPQVAWAGLAQGARQLTELASAVQDAVVPLGFARKPRPYRPHLTLCRIKRAKKDAWEELLRDVQSRQWPAVNVNAFTLWRSVLAPTGPVYEVLSQFEATSL